MKNYVMHAGANQADKTIIAMKELSKAAEENGTSEMTLDEINNEIEIAKMDIAEKQKGKSE